MDKGHVQWLPFLVRWAGSMKYFRQAHVVYHNQYHLVWIPRFRRKILVPGVAAYLEKKLLEVRKYYPDIVYKEINIQPDHVHMLVMVPPRMSVSAAVNILKSNTSAALKQKFPFLKKVYLDEKLKDYILNIVFTSRFPEKKGLTDLKSFIQVGASPRATIGLARAARAAAQRAHPERSQERQGDDHPPRDGGP